MDPSEEPAPAGPPTDELPPTSQPAAISSDSETSNGSVQQEAARGEPVGRAQKEQALSTGQKVAKKASGNSEAVGTRITAASP